jgi:glycosyltransferase involved in cell wall biosynthesis
MPKLTKLQRVCITPQVSGVGGMVSFNAKFSAALVARGIQVTHDLEGAYDSILVIGGTRQISALSRARKRGVPIVQRLDGINWLHRKTRTGPRHWLRAEAANALLASIRKRLSTQIVYQSHFVAEWWTHEFDTIPAPTRVIYNGVDLQHFNPSGPEQPPTDRYRILLVEGSLLGGYELGMESAVALGERLQKEYNYTIEIAVAGRVEDKMKQRWTKQSQVLIEWLGILPNDQIPALNRSAHLLYSSDLNAACPNSVIEALACGLPVLAFDTGALKELVTPQSGRVVPYGGDPWKLDKPDIGNLVNGAAEIFSGQSTMRPGARARAEEAFSLDDMTQAYIEALHG